MAVNVVTFTTNFAVNVTIRVLWQTLKVTFTTFSSDVNYFVFTVYTLSVTQGKTCISIIVCYPTRDL